MSKANKPSITASQSGCPLLALLAKYSGYQRGTSDEGDPCTDSCLHFTVKQLEPYWNVSGIAHLYYIQAANESQEYGCGCFHHAQAVRGTNVLPAIMNLNFKTLSFCTISRRVSLSGEEGIFPRNQQFVPLQHRTFAISQCTWHYHCHLGLGTFVAMAPTAGVAGAMKPLCFLAASVCLLPYLAARSDMSSIFSRIASKALSTMAMANEYTVRRHAKDNEPN